MCACLRYRSITISYNMLSLLSYVIPLAEKEVKCSIVLCFGDCQSLQKNMYKNKVKVTQIINTHVSK